MCKETEEYAADCKASKGHKTGLENGEAASAQLQNGELPSGLNCLNVPIGALGEDACVIVEFGALSINGQLLSC